MKQLFTLARLLACEELDVKNRVRPCARMYLCPPPIKSHEDLSQTIETNKTTTTPRHINSNNLMH